MKKKPKVYDKDEVILLSLSALISCDTDIDYREDGGYEYQKFDQDLVEKALDAIQSLPFMQEKHRQQELDYEKRNQKISRKP